MFSQGVFRKTFADTGTSLVLSAIGLILFVVMFTWAMLHMGTEVLNFVSRVPFIQKIFEMSLGIKVSGDISINVLFAVCFTHGVVMLLIWSVMIATATRVTVGEMEKGTADMLLSLPLNRTEIFVSTSCVWGFAALVLAACPLVGIAVGRQIFITDEVVTLSRFVAPTINLGCLNLAVGSLACMIGTLLQRRSMAVGVVVGVTFVSVVLNFLEPFLESLKPWRFLSLLTYFKPVETVRDESWPVASMVTLLAMAFSFWLIGLIVFRRKDVPAV